MPHWIFWKNEIEKQVFILERPNTTCFWSPLHREIRLKKPFSRCINHMTIKLFLAGLLKVTIFHIIFNIILYITLYYVSTITGALLGIEDGYYFCHINWLTNTVNLLIFNNFSIHKYSFWSMEGTIFE